LTRERVEPRTLIPHRPPILCIDEVVFATGEEAACAFFARDGVHLVNGRFWEPILVEASAQAAAVMSATGSAASGRSFDGGLLVGVRDFRFSSARCPPAERIICHVRVTRRLEPFLIVAATISRGDIVIGAGELRFVETSTA
jgi:predicted hotdog family 3-hydroxylacyl-ACP dehydratase